MNGGVGAADARRIGRRRRVLLPLPLALGLLLASCGSDDPAPLAPASVDTTASMLTVAGEARVSVALDLSLVEAGDTAPLSGALRAILEDSTGQRVFLPRVRVNGAPLVEERDGLGNPAQLTLDVASALPGLALADTIRFAVEDGGKTTPPFTVLIAPSRVELLPDSAVVARGQSLRFRWHGRIERLVVTLTDRFGTRVRANLSFENYSGLREIVLPGRDLAPLAPGPLAVAASVTDTEARFAGPRLVTVAWLSTQRRAWTLLP